MTSELVAIDGATCTQEDAHIIPAGAGTYTITPITLQNFVYVSDKLVIPNSTTYSAHGTATTVPSTTLLYINGMQVVRDDDKVSHHHSNNGVHVGNQSFVYSE